MFDIRIVDKGLINYQEAYDLQKAYVQEVLDGKSQVLIFCQHPTVLTMGRLAKNDNIKMQRSELKKQGVEVFHVDRGGDVTLHAEGQIVLYPILDLKNYGKDLKRYLFKLEQVVIDLLSGFDIVASRLSGKTGVWIGNKKIASMGIGVRKWISFHGLALNVNTDLSQFLMINPCGLGVSMTSVSEILGKNVAVEAVKDSLLRSFCNEFQINTI